jgi:hypothetical protein
MMTSRAHAARGRSMTRGKRQSPGQMQGLRKPEPADPISGIRRISRCLKTGLWIISTWMRAAFRLRFACGRHCPSGTGVPRPVVPRLGERELRPEDTIPVPCYWPGPWGGSRSLVDDYEDQR